MTSGDNEIYYLLGRRVSAGTDDLRLDRLWREAASKGESPEAILVLLRSEGFNYLLDTQFPGNPFGLAAVLKETLDGHPDWVIFQGKESRVIDLGRVGRA